MGYGCTLSKVGHFRSLHDTPVHSAVIAAWLECFTEKSSWWLYEQVCQGVKCKAL